MPRTDHPMPSRAAALADERRLDPRKRLEREIGGLFDELFNPVHPVRAFSRRQAWHPFTDVYEEDERFIIRMELAGIDAESLDLAREGRCLIVRGHRPDPFRGKAVSCHQLEVSYGPFERVICLPVDFDEGSVRPEYQRSSGFLTITIEKSA